MGKNSKIEWTDATWNPWYGCRKVSPGCKFCYAERDMTRYGRDFGEVTRAKDATFGAPLNWKEPRRIFACSWSDWFIQEADPWRDEAWEIIRQTPQHTYLILTKRPQRIAHVGLPWMPACAGMTVHDVIPAKAGIQPWPNVWLGVSVEARTQLQRTHQIVSVPVALRFLSYEPALAPLHLQSAIGNLQWLIVGGESGPKAREFKIEWAYETLAQCRAAGVPCFIKQMGSNATFAGERIEFADPKGADMSEWPEALRVREWPKGILNYELPYIYSWRAKFPRTLDRKGQRCRVLVRGKMNSALVEFADGFRAVVSRNALRRARPTERIKNWELYT